MASADSGTDAAATHDPATLPALAMAHPARAVAAAQSVLATRSDPLSLSFAHHALGIALRESGDLSAALTHLQRAQRDAERSGVGERSADVAATLATALYLAGRVDDGEEQFRRALAASRGALAAQVRLRRATVRFRVVGQAREALADYNAALAVFRRAGDDLWRARTLMNRAMVFTALGEPQKAEAGLEQAEELLSGLGNAYGAALARQGRAEAAYRRGDLPVALAHFQLAAAWLAETGAKVPEVYADWSAALLAAGMPAEAAGKAREATLLLADDAASLARRAGALVAAAHAAVAAGDPAAAVHLGRQALRLHLKTANPGEAARARLVVAGARHLQGQAGVRLFEEARALSGAGELDRTGRTEAALLAARIALTRGDATSALPLLESAARARRPGTPLSRARGWLAAALRAEVRGRRGDVLRACDRGLAVLDEHRLTLGATEMRATATSHGAELAALGLRHAVRSGDAALLLSWSERWRATALSVPPVRPPDDQQLADDLAELRDVTRRLAEAQRADEATDELERARQRLEESARERTLHTRGEGSTTLLRHDPQALVAALGTIVLVELVEVDAELHGVVVDSSGLRARHIGASEDAADEVAQARFALHQVARRAPGSASSVLLRAGAQAVEHAGERLAQRLLGPLVEDLGDACAPVVVVPPGSLHAVPWGLLPAFADREVTVAPSAAVWLRGRAAKPPRRRRVALVAGPDLEWGAAEVAELAAHYPQATVLTGEAATADAVLGALDGAWLAHVAAHGEFRADSPMFSSLHVGDGPLTVHDLCRLRRAPYRMLLSACESGLAAPTGADELLGLASALVPLGTVGLLASVVPVNDAATVSVMRTVHERLRAGASLGLALRDARREAAGDPVTRATAAAFVALGSG